MQLESYLMRITRHPILQRSMNLKLFLESTDMKSIVLKLKNSNFYVENLTDALVNTFSAMKKADDKFLALNEEVNKIEQQLSSIEKIHSSLHQTQKGIFLFTL